MNVCLGVCLCSRSEAFGAPEGYVDGPVWWLPETLKYQRRSAEKIAERPHHSNPLAKRDRTETCSNLKLHRSFSRIDMQTAPLQYPKECSLSKRDRRLVYSCGKVVVILRNVSRQRIERRELISQLKRRGSKVEKAPLP